MSSFPILKTCGLEMYNIRSLCIRSCNFSSFSKKVKLIGERAVRRRLKSIAPSIPKSGSRGLKPFSNRRELLFGSEHAINSYIRDENYHNTILLPVWVPLYELRVLLRLSYPSIFKLSQVRWNKSTPGYHWNDQYGRTFKTLSKRSVFVPFETAACILHKFGHKAVLVDCEPTWTKESLATKTPAPSVVVVLGHRNHGKTTLIDRLCGSQRTLEEPGRLTQNLSCSFIKFKVPKNILETNSSDLTEIDIRTSNKNENPNNYITWNNFWNHNGSCDRFDNTSDVTEIPKEVLALRRTEGRRVNDVEQYVLASSYDKDVEKNFTFIDTPGHEIFDVMRGRMTSLADFALVVVAIDTGVDSQTAEVLVQADRFAVPVIFILNKVDLAFSNIELARHMLRRQCEELYDLQFLKKDLTKEAMSAIPISALLGTNLEALAVRLIKSTDGFVFPLHELCPIKSTNSLSFDECPKKDNQLLRTKCRTECLVDVDLTASGVGVVLEVSKNSNRGTVLTVLMRHGVILEGNCFVVGSSFGTVKRMWSVYTAFQKETVFATAGMAIQIQGHLDCDSGVPSVDDLLILLPKHRAYRLSQYRKSVEKLMDCQTAGPPILVGWQHDYSDGISEVSDLYLDRNKSSLSRRSVEEHGSKFDNRNEIVNDHVPDETNLVEEVWSASGTLLDDNYVFSKLENPSRYTPNLESIYVEPSGKLLEFSSSKKKGNLKRNLYATENRKIHENSEKSKRVGRKSASVSKTDNQTPPVHPSDPAEDSSLDDDSDDTYEEEKRAKNFQEKFIGSFKYNSIYDLDAEDQSEPPSQKASSIHQKWSGYNTREEWVKSVDAKNKVLMDRWRMKSRDRETTIAQRVNAELAMRINAIETEREILGKPPLTEEEISLLIENFAKSDSRNRTSGNDQNKKANKKIPNSDIREGIDNKLPIVPVILKTLNLGLFEAIMDGLDELEAEYSMRIPVVHGGLGPVTPTDVNHSEVEGHYSYCPIYALQVSANPQAIRAALTQKVQIKRFNVFSDLLQDIRFRCENIKKLEDHNIYVRSLKKQSTTSGL